MPAIIREARTARTTHEHVASCCLENLLFGILSVP
jgi:hypothetical protein